MTVSDESGYTLLELLVVIAIAGFMIAGMLGYGGDTVTNMRLKSVAHRVETDLRSLQNKAVAQGIVTSWQLAPDSQSYITEPGGGLVQLPPGTAASIAISPAFAKRPDNVIRFFPDGSAQGGLIDLRRGDRDFRLSVDWLTGRVTLHG